MDSYRVPIGGCAQRPKMPMTHCPNTGTMKAIGIDKPLAKEGRNGVNHGAPNCYPGQQGAIPVPVPKQLFLVTQVQGERGFGCMDWISVAGQMDNGGGKQPRVPSIAFPQQHPSPKTRAARGTPPELTMLQQLHLHGVAHPWRIQNSFPELGKKMRPPSCPPELPLVANNCQHPMLTV